MDADVRDLLRKSIQALLKSNNTDLVAGLAESGWHDLMAEDPAAAVDLLFTEQGRAGRASNALDSVILNAIGGDLREMGWTVLYPLCTAQCVRWNDLLSVDGVALSDPRTVRGCVAAADGAESGVYLLPSEWVGETVIPVRGFDSSSVLYRVRLEVSIANLAEHKCDWAGAMGAARRAVASELVGNGCAMLNIAVDHVRNRKQFGRAIGANQTPRHRLAQCYTRLAGARALVDAAWKSGTPWDAWVAKTYAGYASEMTSRACLQVCGAIGLTSEHRLGGHVKRVRVLDALYGDWRTSTQEIGMTLLQRETIPAGARI